MAETEAGAALTRAHRTVQLRIGEDTARLVAAAWPLLDLARLDATQARWLAAVAPLVIDGRLQSSRAAEAYLRAFGQAERGLSLVVAPADVSDDVRAAVETSLRTQGPVNVKALMANGFSLQAAQSSALLAVAGSAFRHALDGGRETTARSVEADPSTVGWRRVGVGRCGFCRMLIGRGEVYSARTARFASHDSCGCSAEPAFGGERASVVQFAASKRTRTEADRARVRDFLARQDS